MYRIVVADPDSEQARPVLAALSAVLTGMTGSSGTASFASADVRSERAVFLLALGEDGKACGCAALRPLTDEVAEIKRMYAAPGSQALGTQLLEELEQRARDFGYREVWLETRKINRRAVAFYLRHGYCEIDNYGRYIGRDDAICMGKVL